ncbi:MAG: hypothetical protein HY876_05235, partial [Coriobacteriales bacterium]|nr:hypothetical protein [Coriobacteriales bacterium]
MGEGIRCSSRSLPARRARSLRWVAALLLAIVVSLAVGPQIAFAGPGTLIDSGFESGTDGSVLGSPWSLVGAPTRAEYDSARAKSGSLSAWVQGPAAAIGGVYETASGAMTSNGA